MLLLILNNSETTQQAKLPFGYECFRILHDLSCHFVSLKWRLLTFETAIVVGSKGKNRATTELPPFAISSDICLGIPY